jgi:hypothetical protein
MLGVMYIPWWQICLSWISLLLAIFYVGVLVYRGKRPSLRNLLWLIALIAISIGLSIPSVARLPRAFYQEMDQVEWADILESGQPESRQEAITALCEILKDKRNHRWTSVFGVSVQALAVGKAKEALPTLHDLFKNLQDPIRRAQVKNAIDVIESKE